MAKRKRDGEAAYRARKLEQKARAEELAHQRRRTRIAVAVVLVTTFVIAGAVVVPRIGRQSAEQKQAEAVARRPVADFGVNAAAAGCAAVVTQAPGADWPNHVPGSIEYAARPPAGGPHSSRTVTMGRDRFYTREEQPAPERAVHDLEHGVIVGWYDAALPEAEVAALREVAASAGQKDARFVAVPWDRGEFPDDRHFVLTAWGVTQRCTRVSGEVVESFVKTHADAPGLPERGFRV